MALYRFQFLEESGFGTEFLTLPCSDDKDARRVGRSLLRNRPLTPAVEVWLVARRLFVLTKEDASEDAGGGD